VDPHPQSRLAVAFSHLPEELKNDRDIRDAVSNCMRGQDYCYYYNYY